MAGIDCLDAEACADNLRCLDDEMKRAGIPFWLSEGTALGVRRERAFIPHDDDVDVAVREGFRKAFMRDVLPRLEKRGFVVAKVWNQGHFITLFRKEALDIDFVEEGRSCMFLTRGKEMGFRGSCKSLEQFLANLNTISFLGRRFVIPGDDYYQYMYGEDWQTPNRSSTCPRRSIR